MAEPHPKPPATPEKRPKPIPRGKPPQRTKLRAKRAKRIAFGSSYQRPEWLALVKQVRKRSGGLCEARIRCGGNPVQGQPHHRSYADFKGWRRLIVPLSELVDCCHDCHRSFHDRP